MQFYTYHYLLRQMPISKTIPDLITILLASLVLLAVFLYLHFQQEVKYRQLSIIIITILLLVIALKVGDINDYQEDMREHEDVVAIIKQAAKKMDVSPNKIAINAIKPRSRTIVYVNHKFYLVVISAPKRPHELIMARLHIVKPEIQVRK